MFEVIALLSMMSVNDHTWESQRIRNKHTTSESSDGFSEITELPLVYSECVWDLSWKNTTGLIVLVFKSTLQTHSDMLDFGLGQKQKSQFWGITLMYVCVCVCVCVCVTPELWFVTGAQLKAVFDNSAEILSFLSLSRAVRPGEHQHASEPLL